MRYREEALRSLSSFLFCLAFCLVLVCFGWYFFDAMAAENLVWGKDAELLMNPGGWPPQWLVVLEAHLDFPLRLYIKLAYPEVEGEQARSSVVRCALWSFSIRTSRWQAELPGF